MWEVLQSQESRGGLTLQETVEERRGESPRMKMSGSKDDLIICLTFFTLCPDRCLIMEVFLRGDSSYWIWWSQLSAGSRQLRKVGKNVGAMQSEDPDRRTLLLLSEELRHYCKGVFGSSCRLVLLCFSAAWMGEKKTPFVSGNTSIVLVFPRRRWTLDLYYSDQMLPQMTDCLTDCVTVNESEPAGDIEPGT